MSMSRQECLLHLFELLFEESLERMTNLLRRFGHSGT